MKQIEEDEVRFEQQEESRAAAREFEAARQSRITVEEKVYLGLLTAAPSRRTA